VVRYRSLSVPLRAGHRRRQRRQWSSVASTLGWVFALLKSAPDQALGGRREVVSEHQLDSRVCERRGWPHGHQRSQRSRGTGETVCNSIAWTARRWRHLQAARLGELRAVFGVTAEHKGSVRADPIASRLRAGSTGEARCTGLRLVETSSRDALRRRVGLHRFTLLRMQSPSNDRIGSPSVATPTTFGRWESVCAARISSHVRGRRVRGGPFGAS
jgi:hypothetical protein